MGVSLAPQGTLSLVSPLASAQGHKLSRLCHSEAATRVAELSITGPKWRTRGVASRGMAPSSSHTWGCRIWDQAVGPGAWRPAAVCLSWGAGPPLVPVPIAGLTRLGGWRVRGSSLHMKDPSSASVQPASRQRWPEVLRKSPSPPASHTHFYLGEL